MKYNLLKKIFYVPNYLSMPIAGIEICNGSIKFIEFSNKSGEFSVKHFGEVLLLPGIVKDGEVLNKSALVKALAEVKNKISTDLVKISIPEEQTYIFDVQIPKEAKMNIREALEFKIEENVPLKLAESSFEYEIIDNNKSSENVALSVSVIPKKIISEYMEVFDQVDIHPFSYEMESKMIVDSVMPRGDKRNSMVINIKDDSTVLIAVIDGFARLSSIIPIGGNTIKENLLKTGQFEDEFAIEKFFENDFSFEMACTKESCSALVNTFSVIKDEVEKFNEYIMNKFPKLKSPSALNIARIILCGESSTLPGLAKHINQNIKAEVVLADTFSNILDVSKVVPNMKFNDSLLFVTPIGLVVSSNKEMNA